MRKPNLTLSQIKDEIKKLKGKPIDMHVNSGRKNGSL